MESQLSSSNYAFLVWEDQYIYNFQTFQAHKDSVCDIAVSPLRTKDGP